MLSSFVFMTLYSVQEYLFILYLSLEQICFQTSYGDFEQKRNSLQEAFSFHTVFKNGTILRPVFFL